MIVNVQKWKIFSRHINDSASATKKCSVSSEFSNKDRIDNGRKNTSSSYKLLLTSYFSFFVYVAVVLK